MCQKPPIIFQFLITPNLTGETHKNQNKYRPTSISDGRLLNNTMELRVKNFAVLFYARQSFSRAVSLKNLASYFCI